MPEFEDRVREIRDCILRLLRVKQRQRLYGSKAIQAGHLCLHHV